MKLLLLLSSVSTVFNTGLIWTIQLLHYPGFLKVGSSHHQDYHQFHMNAITPLVGISMTIELFSSLSLLFFLNEVPSKPMYWLGVLLLIAIWLHTALIAVPLHSQLSQHFELEIAQKLIDTNWWRTFFWSLRTAIFGYLLFKLLP